MGLRKNYLRKLICFDYYKGQNEAQTDKSVPTLLPLFYLVFGHKTRKQR